MRVLFIVGSGHHGSTLLELLLDGHSKMTSIGEPRDLKRVSEENVFWEKILSGLSIINIPIYRNKIDFLRGSSKFKKVKDNTPIDKERYISFHEKLYSRTLKQDNSLIVVDALKHPGRVELLSKSDDIKPTILHLVRDGRGVTWSYVKKYPRNFLFCMSKWFLSNLKTEIVYRRSRIPYMLVRYEDLVNKPEETLKAILNVLGLSFEPSMMHFRESGLYSVGGNRMKSEKGEDITEDKEWVNEMPIYLKTIFNLFFGWMNLYYKHKKAF